VYNKLCAEAISPLRRNITKTKNILAILFLNNFELRINKKMLRFHPHFGKSIHNFSEFRVYLRLSRNINAKSRLNEADPNMLEVLPPASTRAINFGVAKKSSVGVQLHALRN